jgi:hypothetical protein
VLSDTFSSCRCVTRTDLLLISFCVGLRSLWLAGQVSSRGPLSSLSRSSSCAAYQGVCRADSALRFSPALVLPCSLFPSCHQSRSSLQFQFLLLLVIQAGRSVVLLVELLGLHCRSYLSAPIFTVLVLGRGFGEQ